MPKPRATRVSSPWVVVATVDRLAEASRHRDAVRVMSLSLVISYHRAFFQSIDCYHIQHYHPQLDYSYNFNSWIDMSSYKSAHRLNKPFRAATNGPHSPLRPHLPMPSGTSLMTSLMPDLTTAPPLCRPPFMVALIREDDVGEVKMTTRRLPTRLLRTGAGLDRRRSQPGDLYRRGEWLTRRYVSADLHSGICARGCGAG